MKMLRALLFLAALLAVPTVRADIAPVPQQADREGFTAVPPGEALGPGETLPAARLVGFAYGFVLIALAGWIASVVARARRLEDEVAALRARIQPKA